MVIEGDCSGVAEPLTEPELAKYLEKLGFGEKQLLFKLLTKDVIGPVPTADSQTVFLPLVEDHVAPGCLVSITESCQETFKPVRLVILETLSAKYDQDELVSYNTTKRPWWKPWKKPELVVTSRTYTNRHVERLVPPSAWQITALFVGNKNVLPSDYKYLGGDLFSKANIVLDFQGITCNTGISVCLQAKHKLLDGVPFMAVLVGTRAEVSKLPHVNIHPSWANVTFPYPMSSDYSDPATIPPPKKKKAKTLSKKPVKRK
jgi:hypothetical protein